MLIESYSKLIKYAAFDCQRYGTYVRKKTKITLQEINAYFITSRLQQKMNLFILTASISMVDIVGRDATNGDKNCSFCFIETIFDEIDFLAFPLFVSFKLFVYMFRKFLNVFAIHSA